MNKLLLSLTGAAATGALTLISPTGWSPQVRRAYVIAPGVLIAGGSSLLLTKMAHRQAATAPSNDSTTETTAENAHPLPRRHPITVQLTVPIILGVTTCGIQAFSLWIDAALERGLTRLGTPHPRRWMAALAMAVSLGTDAAGAHWPTRMAKARPAL